MRIYEELFIVKPDVPEEEADQFVETLRTQLTAAGATVDKVEKWGKRKLAYRVDKYREGARMCCAGQFHFESARRGCRVGAPPARFRHGAEISDRAH